MTAGIYNFTIDQGSTWTLQLIYKDPNGAPINLSGYTAKMQLRSKFDSADAVLTLTSGSGITIDGPTGTINLVATDEQTEAIKSGFYVYDLELSNGGVITRLIQGQVTLSPQVTLSV